SRNRKGPLLLRGAAGRPSAFPGPQECPRGSGPARSFAPRLKTSVPFDIGGGPIYIFQSAREGNCGPPDPSYPAPPAGRSPPMPYVPSVGPACRLRRSPRRNARTAAMAVELAVLLPVLVFLFAVGVDFARVFYYQLTIENCARNGALFGSN